MVREKISCHSHLRELLDGDYTSNRKSKTTKKEDGEFLMKYFEVFKAGNYPQGKFSKEEIQELAKNYDPSFCEAPITLDHEQKGPAYGWVDKLKEEDGTLKASFKDLSDDLKEFVNQGKYKKISVEIYRELEGKKPYLKAVSFLGASIPQVKGMQPVEFKEGESEVFIFETQTEEEDETENIEELKTTIQDLKKQVADFKEKAQNKETIKDLKTQVKNLNVELAKFKDEAANKDEIAKELQDLKATIRDKDFNEFVDSQISAGILTPANKDAVLSILQDLDNVKKFDESSNSIEQFKNFISALPKQVEFDEVAQKNAKKKSDDSIKYADADEESLEIFNQAQSIAKEENISFREALLKIKEV